MRKVLLATLLFLLSNCAWACGGLTHMFIAHDVIKQLPDKTLRNILLDHHDAYLVGSYYPDSGYIKGTGYGEDSHWDEFIYAFADYLKQQPDLLQNQKLIAFLFGCATHRVADEKYHYRFLRYIAEHDSHHNKNSAHTYGDSGLDILINIDKQQWFNYPKHWWVPVKHLVQVYKNMHKPEYTAHKIILGNTAIYFAGIGERLIAVFAYPYWHFKMPWTARNYMTWPDGGINSIEKNVVTYHMQLWNYLYHDGTKPVFTHKIPYHTEPNLAVQITEKALQDKKLVATTDSHANDASVDISSENHLWQFREDLKAMCNIN